MGHRLSRGTPYILTSADIENALKALTPRTEAAIAQVLELTAEQWHALDDKVKVRHIIDFQNRSILAASLAAGAKVHTDLEEAAYAVTRVHEADTLADEVRALRELVTDLTADTNTRRGNRR